MNRILMIEDHPVVVDGVKAVLPDMIDELVHRPDAESGLEYLRQHSVDLVILALMLPGMGGQEAVRRLTRHYPKIKILIFSAHCATPICHWLIERGVAALVDKNAGAAELHEALKRVTLGQRYLSQSVAQSQVLGMSDQDQLSEREFQVIQLLLSGQRPQQIADALFISHKTVSTYRQRAMTRLGLSTELELAQYAIAQGWINGGTIPA